MSQNLPVSLGRLLIVDDEARLMMALRDTLRDQGYEVVGVTSGAEALAVLSTSTFDLLLTDLSMPAMDGITLLTAALKSDPNLVGIMMTAHGTIATAVEAMRIGAFDYILKPFKLSAVLPVINRALSVRKLRLHNAELQRRISERTAELEVANKELEAFSYSVSHDLRAPLRAIAGFASFVQQDCASLLPVASQQNLQQVLDSVGRMGRLIDSLLEFSRCGRQPLAKVRVVTSDLVARVLEDLRAGRADGSLVVRVGDLPDCQADPGLLRQVWVNLLSNALKFSRGREAPRIEVGCRQEAGENIYFVRDNGAGFEMKYASKLFGVFQRMHRQEEFEGTGVGLSIVQSIVHRHGGRIWAEARLGEGATFHFTLAPATAA